MGVRNPFLSSTHMFNKTNGRFRAGLSSTWFAALLLISPGLFGGVCSVKVPTGGISPDVTVGRSGAVYLVFGRDGNAYFVVSKDDGRSFSAPRRLNPSPGTVLVGHERGPKIAVGKNEALHVIWMDAKSERLEYTRSEARGEGFSPPRNLLDPKTHLDGATISADDSGEVRVSWLDARLPPDPDNPISLPIFTTVSRDNGVTFSPNAPLRANLPIRACSCCGLKSIRAPGGVVEMAYRGAYQNVRDPFLARIPAGDETPALVRKIQEIGWRFNGCPMAGPSLYYARDSQEVWAAWMSDGEVYFAESGDEGRTFLPARKPPARKLQPRNHPLILVNTAGQVFLAWEEGLEEHWQISDRAGKVLSSGDAGTLPEKSKAAGFIDRSGNFCLVF
jgi:hypothetical protein